jgi:hypothetical protein
LEDRIKSLENWTHSLENRITCPVKPEAKGVDQAQKGVNRKPTGVAKISCCAIWIRVPVAEEVSPLALHHRTAGRIRCPVTEKLSPGMMS